MKSVFKWCENAVIVKGYSRSAIYDLQRQEYNFCNNGIEDLILKISKQNKNEITTILDETEKLWLEWLIEKEYLVEVPENLFEYFDEIDYKFESPFFISNAIIEYHDDIPGTIRRLESLGCKHFHLKLNDADEFFNLIENIPLLDGVKTISINISILNRSPHEIIEIIQKEPIIDYVSYNELKDEIIEANFHNSFFFKVTANSGNFPVFSINIKTYTEALNYNLYFNKKIFIDKNGAISLTGFPKSGLGFLHLLSNDDIKALIETETVQSLWQAKKSNIDICKICEFRLMCVDKRIPIKRSENEWYINNECIYNPLIAKWSHEEGYKTIEECGVVSNHEKFSIDTNIVNQINLELWADE